VIVGCIGLLIPEVLGTGYGWIQQGLGHQLLTLPLWIVLILPFARIVATGSPSVREGPVASSDRAWSSVPSSAPPSGDCSSRSSLRWAQSGALRDRGHDVLLREHLPSAIGRHADGGGDDRKPLDLGAGDDRRRIGMVHRQTGDDTIYRSQLKNRADAPAQRL